MKSTSPRRANRPRSDDHSLDDPPPTERSDLWYRDGSVVLQADTTQFRVHMSVLSEQSTVFCDMFSVGTPQDSEVVEGCPVVRIFDEPNDVANVLRALYNRQFYSDGSPTQTMPFRVVSSWIRLGRKYDLQCLYKEAVQCLRNDYPSDLDSFYHDHERLMRYPGIELDIIRLARSEELTFIFPQVLMHCSTQYELEDTMHGFGLEQHVEGLSPEDFLLCVAGRDRLHTAGAELLRSWDLQHVYNIPDCGALDNCCNVAASSVLSAWAQSRPGPNLIFYSWEDEWAERLCSACADSFKGFYENWRAELWRRLPSFYKLPPWQDLLATVDQGRKTALVVL